MTTSSVYSHLEQWLALQEDVVDAAMEEIARAHDRLLTQMEALEQKIRPATKRTPEAYLNGASHDNDPRETDSPSERSHYDSARSPASAPDSVPLPAPTFASPEPSVDKFPAIETVLARRRRRLPHALAPVHFAGDAQLSRRSTPVVASTPCHAPPRVPPPLRAGMDPQCGTVATEGRTATARTCAFNRLLIASPPKGQQTSSGRPAALSAIGALRVVLLRSQLAHWRALHAAAVMRVPHSHDNGARAYIRLAWKRLRRQLRQRASRLARPQLRRGLSRLRAAAHALLRRRESIATTALLPYAQGWRRWSAWRAMLEEVASLCRRAECRLRLRRLRRGFERCALRARFARLWRRKVEERERERGGILRQHLPCMRRFDARAVFLEGGSKAMAEEYRSRRIRATHLYAWSSHTFLRKSTRKSENQLFPKR
ncbi:hypothetical protein AB1Y20_009026 [Prymnesium parvum]|uniref:Uncharacterized protein n=1 Tax=Prymnesium parvum TaxID=97485 RepID=A0AB34K0F7_PRYPA